MKTRGSSIVAFGAVRRTAVSVGFEQSRVRRDGVALEIHHDVSEALVPKLPIHALERGQPLGRLLLVHPFFSEVVQGVHHVHARVTLARPQVVVVLRKRSGATEAVSDGYRDALQLTERLEVRYIEGLVRKYG